MAIGLEQIPYDDAGNVLGSWTIHHEAKCDVSILGVPFKDGVARGVDGFRFRRIVAAAGHALVKALREDEDCVLDGTRAPAGPPARPVSERLMDRVRAAFDRMMALLEGDELRDAYHDITGTEPLASMTAADMRAAAWLRFEAKARHRIAFGGEEGEDQVRGWLADADARLTEAELEEKLDAAEDEAWEDDATETPTRSWTAESLAAMPWNDLTRLAADHGVYKPGMKKADVIEALLAEDGKD